MRNLCFSVNEFQRIERQYGITPVTLEFSNNHPTILKETAEDKSHIHNFGQTIQRRRNTPLGKAPQTKQNSKDKNDHEKQRVEQANCLSYLTGVFNKIRSAPSPNSDDTEYLLKIDSNSSAICTTPSPRSSRKNAWIIY